MFADSDALLDEKIKGIRLFKTAQLDGRQFSEAVPVCLFYIFTCRKEDFYALRKADDKFVNVTFRCINAVNDQQYRCFI